MEREAVRGPYTIWRKKSGYHVCRAIDGKDSRFRSHDLLEAQIVRDMLNANAEDEAMSLRGRKPHGALWEKTEKAWDTLVDARNLLRAARQEPNEQIARSHLENARVKIHEALNEIYRI